MNALDAHVDALAATLRGPATVRRDMLREVRDGLHDATSCYVDAGMPADAAAELAVRDFGTVDELAAEYQRELTARQGRASALLVMLGFPATALGWELMWRSGVKWTPTSDAGTSAVIKSLAWWEGFGAAAIAVVAAVLLAHTFLRRTEPRRVTALIGLTAGVGAIVEAGLAAAMTILNGPPVLTQNPTALPAYLISAAMLTAVLTAATRSVRTARA
jgi:hypothetical protein